eukprot:Gregarina_sp_Pseudo_9__1058@NODE_1687_length_1399_cov_83_450000_g1563_i0_p2_GENE_NODE_1687_length_1399_cov_83_450000_g1563_i0NODE_1687_length_1399_cov_83_450000_g1563_i0_p2_ORF_typecomplete_len113_score22_86_NODE_1687_length_1399_cov_83_450000_g1563_i0628966
MCFVPSPFAHAVSPLFSVSEMQWAPMEGPETAKAARVACANQTAFASMREQAFHRMICQIVQDVVVSEATSLLAASISWRHPHTERHMHTHPHTPTAAPSGSHSICVGVSLD